MSTRQANIDQAARDLYTRFHLCGACQGAVTLAEQLSGRCPHCAAPIFAGPFTPDRARERLAELKTRRQVLGLKNTPEATASHKERIMNSEIGLWIDHRQAVIVVVTDAGEETKRIISNMEKHTRFSSGSSEDGSAEDVRDRQFGNHLNSFYDEVVAVIRDADAIQIFGPGEAKGELEKRLEHAGFKGQLVGIETVDKMTDRQIAAKVRAHFLA
ncbi:MAG: hypothetical protein KA765_06310 [Thermoflexales bacterium]|nr:hypothetical protein [Thermoflexales bacterium]